MNFIKFEMKRVKETTTFPYNEVLHFLVKFNIYTENNVVRVKSDIIWKQISASVNNVASPVNIYNYVRQNRQNILSKYNQLRGLSLQNQIIEYDIINESNSKENENVLFDKGNYDVDFKVTLSYEEWLQIKPIKKIYENGRSDFILQQGWTDLLVKKFWETQKLPCIFNFKRAKVNETSLPYLEMYGYCGDKDCDAEVFVECVKKPDVDEEVIFHIYITNTHNIIHSGKRRMAGVERRRIKDELKYKKAAIWRREQANKLIACNNSVDEKLILIEPAHLYRLNVLRKAREEAINEELGIQNPISIWDSIDNLKRNVEFNKFIRDIGYNKFHVLYWSLHQIQLYNDIQKQLKNWVSLDATGSIVLKISRGDLESGAIFLYCIITHIEREIVPVAQMLSEKHDTNFLTYMLNEWKKTGAILPECVVTDMSKALQNAVCLAFNGSNFHEYNDNCLQILLNENFKILNLKCWLRTDIAHLMNAVTRWKCFHTKKSGKEKNRTMKIKEFYCRIIGYMSTIKYLQEFVDILKMTLLVINCETETETCEKAKKSLIERIRTFKIEENVKNIMDKSATSIETMQEKDNNAENAIMDLDEERSDKQKISIHNYIQTIKQEISYKIPEIANQSDFETKSNDYYFPALDEDLLRLCTEFPTWTNVMQRYFGNCVDVATSARSELYFADIKQSVLEYNRPIRADKFLIKHCRQIDASIKISRTTYNKIIQSKMTSNQLKKVTKRRNDELCEMENWRGKILDTGISEDSYHLNLSFPEKDNCSLNYDDIQGYYIINQETNETIFNENIIYASSFKDSKNIEKDMSEILQEEKEIIICPEQQLVNENFIDVKKRGKYVSADPAVVLKLQRPVGKRPKGIIQNGNNLKPITINGKCISFINTCAFDSIAELITSAYSYIQEFRNFVDDTVVKESTISNVFNFLQLVRNYAIQGPNLTVYSYRVYILQSLYPNANYIDCTTSVNDLFKKLMKDFPASVQVTTCIFCSTSLTINESILPVPSISFIYKQGYKSLEQQINDYIKEKEAYCHKCQATTARRKIIIGPYLCVDSESVYECSYIANQHGINIKNYASNINDLPQKIKIENNTYILCGLIAHKKPIENGLGHYVAYCRSISGLWFIYDDLRKTCQILPSKTQPTVRISTILYVKCSEYE